MTRIGLSATQKPIETMAELLGGARAHGRSSSKWRRDGRWTLRVEVPGSEIGAVASNELWGEIYDRLATLAREHRSTLVFVNTRRLAERVSHHLAERLGTERVAAHHGSLARRTPARSRTPTEGGRASRHGRDRLARARHRRRHHRPGLSHRIAAFDRRGATAQSAAPATGAVPCPKGRFFADHAR